MYSQASPFNQSSKVASQVKTFAKPTGKKLREIIEDNQEIDSLIKNKIMKKKEKIKSNLMNFSNPGNLVGGSAYYKLHLETSQAYQPSLFKPAEEKKNIINPPSHKRSSSTLDEETPIKKNLVSPRLEKLISKYGDFFEKKDNKFDSASNLTKSKLFSTNIGANTSNGTNSYGIKNTTSIANKDTESYRESVVLNLKSTALKNNSNNYKTIASKTSAGTKANSRKNSLEKIVFKNAINIKDLKNSTNSSTNNSVSNLLSGKLVERNEVLVTNTETNKHKIAHNKMLSDIPVLSTINLNLLNNLKKEKSIKSVSDLKASISSTRKIEVSTNSKKKQIPLPDSLKNSLGRLEDFASIPHKDPSVGSAMSIKKYTPITTSHSPSHIFTKDIMANFKEKKNSTPISPKSKFMKKEINMKNLDLGVINMKMNMNMNMNSQLNKIALSNHGGSETFKGSIPMTFENRMDRILDNSTDSIRSTMREHDFFRKESERIVQYIRQCKNCFLLRLLEVFGISQDNLQILQLRKGIKYF
jgi:hypothetical protein